MMAKTEVPETTFGGPETNVAWPPSGMVTICDDWMAHRFERTAEHTGCVEVLDDDCVKRFTLTGPDWTVAQVAEVARLVIKHESRAYTQGRQAGEKNARRTFRSFFFPEDGQ